MSCSLREFIPRAAIKVLQAFITTWDDSPNPNQATDSDEEAINSTAGIAAGDIVIGGCAKIRHMRAFWKPMHRVERINSNPVAPPKTTEGGEGAPKAVASHMRFPTGRHPVRSLLSKGEEDYDG
jgi:hypothetical protein